MRKNNTPRITGLDDSSIINQTNDDNIVGYLTEKICLSYYEGSDTAKQKGILASAMTDKDFLKKMDNIKSKLEKFDTNALRLLLSDCIVKQKSLTTIIEGT